MSQESVDVLKVGMECFERRDVEAAMELLDPEVEWRPAFTALLGGEETVFRGHDGAREVMRQFWEVFSETDFEISEIRDLGDQALAIGTMRARSRKRRGDRIALGMADQQQGGQGNLHPGIHRSGGGHRGGWNV